MIFQLPRYGDSAALQASAAPPKPVADPTRKYRFSEAYSCPRAIAYRVIGVEQSNPPTPGDCYIMDLGTNMHSGLGPALVARYGQAEIQGAHQDEEDNWILPDEIVVLKPGLLCEVKRTYGDWSGHIDWVHWTEDGRVVVADLKTQGDYAWKKSTGLTVSYQRGRGHVLKQRDPDPPSSAVAQISMGVAAMGADEGVLVVLAREPVSKTAAESVGLDDILRFCAEWTSSASELDPVAQAVLYKGHRIDAHLTKGELPAGWSDEKQKEIHPSTDTTWWQCRYCNYRDRCKTDGAGVVPVPVELRTNR